MMLATEKDRRMSIDIISMLTLCVWDEAFYLAHKEELDRLGNAIMMMCQATDEGEKHD